MSEWKKFTDELPPIGKKLVLHQHYNFDSLVIATFGYNFQYDDHRMHSMQVDTKEGIMTNKGYWLELPPIPKE